jgi:hypothetical protein
VACLITKASKAALVVECLINSEDPWSLLKEHK